MPTIKELKAELKANNIKGYSNKNKADLIILLRKTTKFSDKVKQYLASNFKKNYLEELPIDLKEIIEYEALPQSGKNRIDVKNAIKRGEPEPDWLKLHRQPTIYEIYQLFPYDVIYLSYDSSPQEEAVDFIDKPTTYYWLGKMITFPTDLRPYNIIVNLPCILWNFFGSYRYLQIGETSGKYIDTWISPTHRPKQILIPNIIAKNMVRQIKETVMENISNKYLNILTTYIENVVRDKGLSSILWIAYNDDTELASFPIGLNRSIKQYQIKDFWKSFITPYHAIYEDNTITKKIKF